MTYDKVGPGGSLGHSGSTEGPAEPNSSGLVDGKWHAPDRFAHWLASQLRDDGKSLSVEIHFRPDGILVFLYRVPGRSVPLFLVVGRRGSKGRLCRFGTLLVPLPCPENLSTFLLAYTEKRLGEIFPKDPPTWLRRRAQNVNLLGWGATFMQEFCHDLLVPGTTQWGDCFLRSELFEPTEGLTLEIAGEPSFSLRLLPSSQPAGANWVGQYGPLVLTISDPAYLKHPFVNYIGYALSLLVPPNAKLKVFDENDGDWVRTLGDAMSEDPFLIGSFRSHDENAKALFGAKGNVVCVGNLDRECLTYAGAPMGQVEGTSLDLWHVPMSQRFLDSFQYNNVSDLEILTANGEEKLAEVVRQVLETHPELVIVHGGCTSQLMGESSQRSVECALAQTDARLPCIAVDVCLEDGSDYRRLWDTLLEQTSPAKRPSARPNSVNLVGYGHDGTPSKPELLSLLREVGIEDVQLLLPTFDTRLLPGFSSAAVTVVYPSPHVIDSFSLARRHCPTPPIFPRAPWGVAATLDWLNSILLALGRPRLSTEQAERLTQRYLPPEFSEWKQRARDYRIGFICSRRYAKQEESWVRHGMPLPQIVGEMGFGLDLMLLPSKRGLPLRVPMSTLAGWQIQGEGKGPNRLVPADNDEPVEQLLSRVGSAVVYSEWEGDERVLGSGRPCFSWSDMQMGIAGAGHNVQLLLRMARAPFFGRYTTYSNRPIPRG